MSASVLKDDSIYELMFEFYGNIWIRHAAGWPEKRLAQSTSRVTFWLCRQAMHTKHHQQT